MVTLRQEYKTIITQADRSVDHSISKTKCFGLIICMFQLPPKKKNGNKEKNK